MATVVHLPRSQRALALERGASGLGAGIGSKLTDADNKLFSTFLSDIRGTSNKRDAIELSRDPKYEKLFDSFDDIAAFGKILEQIFPEDRSPISLQDIITTGPEGKQSSSKVPLSQNDLRSIRGGTDLNQLLGLEQNSQAQFGTGNLNKELIDIVSGLDQPNAGRLIRQTPAGQVKLGAGELTSKGFERQRKLRTSGAGSKETAEIRAARGILSNRGIKETSANINNALRITRQAKTVNSQLANSFRVKLNEKGIAESFKNPADAQRFSVAQSAIQDLMFSGLSSSQTLRAAQNVGNAIPVTTSDIDNPGQQLTLPPNKPALPITESNLDALKKSDIGKVLERDGELFVFVGFGPNGEVLAEPVNINIRGL